MCASGCLISARAQQCLHTALHHSSSSAAFFFSCSNEKVPRLKYPEQRQVNTVEVCSLRMSYKAAASSIWCDYVCPRLITKMLLIFRNTPEHSDAASNHNSWTSTKMIYLNISIKLKKELYECKKLCCFITVYRKFKVSSWSNRLLRLGSFWVSQFWLFYCEFK